MPKLFRSLILATALIASPIVGVQAATGDVGAPPKVGQTLPHDLALPDQDGQRMNYMSRARKKGLIVLFTRSVGWWGSCKAQAVAWQDNLDKFRALGYELALLSYDKPDVVKTFAERREITYPMLSDEGSKAILAFGLTEAEGSRDSRWWGVAEPAIFVVGKSGKVTHRFLDQDIAHSPDPTPILDALRQ